MAQPSIAQDKLEGSKPILWGWFPLRPVVWDLVLVCLKDSHSLLLKRAQNPGLLSQQHPAPGRNKAAVGTAVCVRDEHSPPVPALVMLFCKRHHGNKTPPVMMRVLQ